MMRYITILLLLFSKVFCFEPSIVFVHIGERLPQYLEWSIRQARLFNDHTSIYLLSNKQAIATDLPQKWDPKLKVISLESLSLSEEHHQFKKSMRRFRFYRGFWRFTLERFLYLQEFMDQYHIEHAFHLESDNMLYVNLKSILPIFLQYYNGLALPFDHSNRGMGSFIYIKDKFSIRNFNRFINVMLPREKNDMELLAIYRNEASKQDIDALPIAPAGYFSVIQDAELFSNHNHHFDAVFDAAAIGQFLGGIDPNNGVSIPGFINETARINMNDFDLKWEKDILGRAIPYIIFNGKKQPIINLHIHSKKLSTFYSLNM